MRQFTAEHIAVLALTAIAVAIAVTRPRLIPAKALAVAIWRAFNATLVMAAVAGAADLITGGNYMYLRAKPSQPSLLDEMGPWPLYIVSAAALALVLFAMLALLERRVSHHGAP